MDIQSVEKPAARSALHALRIALGRASFDTMKVCKREWCNEACGKVLSCGCPCRGMCGEVCPQICLKHTPDAKVYDEYVMETQLEDAEPNDRFLQLACPCKRVLPVAAMDSYMDGLDGKTGIIFPTCMFCRAVLWRYPLRYMMLFKRIQAEVDIIKHKILDGTRNEKLQ